MVSNPSMVLYSACSVVYTNTVNNISIRLLVLYDCVLVCRPSIMCAKIVIYVWFLVSSYFVLSYVKICGFKILYFFVVGDVRV